MTGLVPERVASEGLVPVRETSERVASEGLVPVRETSDGRVTKGVGAEEQRDRSRQSAKAE